MSLFRSEFIEARKKAGIGSVLIPPQTAILYAAFAMAALISLALIIASFLSYTRYDSFDGFVVEDVARIAMASPVDAKGHLTELYVHEGDTVVPGKPVGLVTIEGDFRDVGASQALNTFVYPLPKEEGQKKTSVLLASTQAGIVDRIFIKGGGSVAFTQPLMTLKIQSRGMLFQALIPGRAVGAIKPGDELGVKVNSIALDEQASLIARVKYISRSSVGPLEISSMYGIPPPIEQKFIVDLEMDAFKDKAVFEKLRPGMTISVKVPVKSKSIFKWLLGMGD